jgi:AcrR family transcriptional regulator
MRGTRLPKRSFAINGMRDDAVPHKRFVIKITRMAEQATDTVRRPRADAVRNRERVLAAAKAVFSAGGPEASLEAVAKKAGVGIGTLYRHFPTRQDLFEAIYRREVQQLVELAEELQSAPAPVDALRCWLRSNVEFVATKKGMSAALALAVHGSSDLAAFTFDRLTKAVGALLNRAIAAGEIRSDISPEDLLRALVGMCYMHDQPHWQESVIRLVDVFVDGLRVRTKADSGSKLSARGAASGKPVNRRRQAGKRRK